MAGLVRGVPIGQIFPWRSGPQNPENAIENFAIGDTWAPGGCRGREDVFDPVPLSIGNVHGFKLTREDEAISVEIMDFWSFEIASSLFVLAGGLQHFYQFNRCVGCLEVVL